METRPQRRRLCWDFPRNTAVFLLSNREEQSGEADDGNWKETNIFEILKTKYGFELPKEWKESNNHSFFLQHQRRTYG